MQEQGYYWERKHQFPNISSWEFISMRMIYNVHMIKHDRTAKKNQNDERNLYFSGKL